MYVRYYSFATKGDLNEHEEQLLVAEGGKGGDFASDFMGRKGNRQMLILDLKLIADIGLIGYVVGGMEINILLHMLHVIMILAVFHIFYSYYV